MFFTSLDKPMYSFSVIGFILKYQNLNTCIIGELQYMSTGSSVVDSTVVQSFMYIVNNKGDSTAPWGAPVLVVTIFEKKNSF